MQQSKQAAALLLRSNRNAQEVFDPPFLEMPHQHAALAKPGGEIRAAVAAMAREYEIRHGRQNLEAQLREGADQRLPTSHDAFAGLLKPCIVGDRRNRAGDGEAIKGVGVEAVLHPFQRVDQRPLANGKANSQSSERPRLGEGLDDQEIVVARDERYRAFGAKVDVSLVDNHQLVRMFGHQRFDRFARKPNAGGSVRIGQQDGTARSR